MKAKARPPAKAEQPTRELSEFVANVRYGGRPEPVVDRAWRLHEERDVREFPGGR